MSLMGYFLKNLFLIKNWFIKYIFLGRKIEELNSHENHVFSSTAKINSTNLKYFSKPLTTYEPWYLCCILFSLPVISIIFLLLKKMFWIQILAQARQQIVVKITSIHKMQNWIPLKYLTIFVWVIIRVIVNCTWLNELSTILITKMLCLLFENYVKIIKNFCAGK